MQKLLTYLKQGKGRGLKAMLIFSVLATLIVWGINYTKVQEQLLHSNPNLSSGSIFGINVGIILCGFILLWLFYLAVVGLSKFFSWAFHLKLQNGSIWRITTFSIIAYILVNVLASLITVILMTLLEFLLPISVGIIATIIYGLLTYIINFIVFLVLLVVLIAFALAEPREGKKKK